MFMHSAGAENIAITTTANLMQGVVASLAISYATPTTHVCLRRPPALNLNNNIILSPCDTSQGP